VGLFDKFNLEDMIEKAMEHIDMEEITAQVMHDLKITDLDIFFVVYCPDGYDVYEFVGMAYSIDSARELRDDSGGGGEILKLDMMKMIPLAKQMGFVETVI
jgi:hypothetical protein